MIIKPCEIPIKARLLEALLCRLPVAHPKRPVLESELGKCMAGYRGEQSIDSVLAVLPEKEYLLFHDLRIPSTPYPFQLDILILSSSFFLILEVKNIAGEIYFDDDFHQLIQTKHDQAQAYDDPILQVNRQRTQLLQWLTPKRAPTIPVETLVVSANSLTIVRAKNKEVTEKVVRRNSLALKINSLAKKHQEDILSKKELKRLTNLLLKAHTPYIPKLLTTYKISATELLTGVQCPNCRALPMKRKWGKWHCQSCSYCSSDAHLAAIRDYALLIKPTVTNRELRDFLRLDSASVAAKWLHSMNLPYTGSTRDRVYHLNWHDFAADWHDYS
ncbi:NERD domain-containing protein [Peribacillus asahii]|uniref:NERD domain-containing protein n=1 Tax=Peribacillus asahii TaxID=228899 RepID=A0A398B7I9_9BACI|nr:nuclease-related domain-containing protein [Peribacillus asahii]RID84778.1 NERD domain-containing protein [Peribacillus asahii]